MGVGWARVATGKMERRDRISIYPRPREARPVFDYARAVGGNAAIRGSVSCVPGGRGVRRRTKLRSPDPHPHSIDGPLTGWARCSNKTQPDGIETPRKVRHSAQTPFKK